MKENEIRKGHNREAKHTIAVSLQNKSMSGEKKKDQGLESSPTDTSGKSALPNMTNQRST